jgi:transcriptional regulator with XRE-family HTH domain
VSQYAARYRAARAFADLSQEELAARLGVDSQTIKRREAGNKDPKKAELIAVAAVCGVPLEFMEHGWGAVGRDELAGLVGEQNGLLARQSSILEEIRAEQAAVRGLLDTQLSAAQEMEAAAADLRREMVQEPTPERPGSG